MVTIPASFSLAIVNKHTYLFVMLILLYTKCQFLCIQITTTSLRIKESREGDSPMTADGGVAKDGESVVLYEFPLFRISYCGTNQSIEEAFSFVAKDTDGK